MQSTANSPQEYIDSLPEDRKAAMEKLRSVVLKNLPKGFHETMGYGMLGYVVPHSTYPNGYHCNPKTPLPFLSIASQKNFVAVYHMGMYSDKNLFDWFTSEYPNHVKTKLDIGKSCIRFKKMDQIPYELLAELFQKMTVEDWVFKYESILNQHSKQR